MSEKLYEIVEANPHFTKLFEAKDNSPFLATIQMTVLPADKKNKNSRYYPESIVKRETLKMQEKLKTQNIGGALEHDPSGLAKLGNISHAITDIWFDEKTKSALAKAHVLKTTSGKNLLTLMQSKIHLGASVVGHGEVGADGRIMDNYNWCGIDLVAAPSFGDATKVDSKNLLESANTVIEREPSPKEDNYIAERMADPKVKQALLEEQKKALLEEQLLIGSFPKKKEDGKKTIIPKGMSREEFVAAGTWGRAK